MGYRNDSLYLQRFKLPHPKYVIEIGSKDHGSNERFRDMIPAERYVGVDIEAGPGVDVVCDVTSGEGLPEGGADLLISCSVMEHTPKPWKMAEHMSSLVRSGGMLYVVVPWVWRYHMYPDDYFRISFRGLQALFPDFDWIDQSYASMQHGKFWKAERNSDNEYSMVKDNVKYMPYLCLHSLGVKH